MKNNGMRKGFKLNTLLFMLVSGAVMLTALTGSLYSWKENKTSLTNTYLDSNYQYAKKLAANTNEILGFMRDTLEDIANRTGQEMLTEAELEVWLKGNKHNFNSIFIVNKSFKVLAASPKHVKTKVGDQAPAELAGELMNTYSFQVSGPYYELGEYSLVLTVPMRDEFGLYQGFVAGVVRLAESNALSRLLNEHFYGDGSYLYVANQEGRLIIHPDGSRINEQVTTNDVIRKGISGLSGSQQVVNSRGISFFAGYAYEPTSGWVIVSQTPTSVLEQPLEHLIHRMLLYTLPLFLLIWLISWLLSLTISKPLYALASFSERYSADHLPDASKLPSPKSWIYEVKQLHMSLSKQLRLWNREVQTDGLTGLANRRTFDRVMEEWIAKGFPFAVILIDIDYFKRVNDKYGHLVGDQVLQFVAAYLQDVTRDSDLCFRYGGEEFGILARFASEAQSVAIAERLRREIAAADSPIGEPIHLSIGIAMQDGNPTDAAGLFERADKALYLSKERGRNRTNVYKEE